jgi:murein DD-endopeptidase MepM/ murein hydrolase activator NlpD
VAAEVAGEVAGEVVPTAAAAVALPPVPGDWKIARAEVKRTLSDAFIEAAGEDGTALSAVFSRLFVWDMDLRRDLRKGDQVEVAWRRTPEGTIEILAARMNAAKLGRTLSAYRWQAPGDAFASYWKEDGTEVPHQLQNSPIKDYEQITSLLKDRPTHQGMDFKAPVGTLIFSPYAGEVTRTDWNWKSNGNSVEVRFSNGAMAKFLHLSETKVKPGDRIAAGHVLGLCGNTGHSTASHLHYQIEVGGKVVDPLEYHGTVRRKVEGSSMAALQTEIARMDGMLAI